MNETFDSGFSTTDGLSAAWEDIALLSTRQHAVLYRARRYGRPYILKALRPEHQSLTDYRLLQEREFQVGISLHHPGIVETYSLEDVNGIGRVIVIEYVDGCTLREWLQTQPSRAERIRLWQQLEDTMDYLRSRQMEHHDLKADNILVTRDGRYLKLIDFGLSGTEAGRKDEEALAQLEKRFFPGAAERWCIHHAHTARAFFIVLAAVLLLLSLVFYGLTRYERISEQRQEQAMRTHIETEVDKQLARMEAVADSADNYPLALREIGKTGTDILRIGDSILSAYPEGHPYHYRAREIWNQRYVAGYNRIVEKSTKKPMKW